MIGCFNHGLFNFIANEMIDSTFFKTKDKEVCDKTNIFVNHPCRCNTFCIILLSPKNFAFFVRWKSFHKFRQKKIKNEQIWTMKSKNVFTRSPASPPPNTLIHKTKHTHSLPTNSQSPLETVLTPLRRVFESLLQIMFATN